MPRRAVHPSVQYPPKTRAHIANSPVRRAALAGTATLVCVLTLAACGRPTPDATSPEVVAGSGAAAETLRPVPTGKPPAEQPGRVGQTPEQLAEAAADRWEREHGAGSPRPFAPLHTSPRQIGVWEPSKGDVSKMAFNNGCLDIAPGLLPTTPQHAQIGWPDGTVQRRSIVSPLAAYDGIPPDQRARCGSASYGMLTVTSVKLTDARFKTAWGPVDVPVWELSFADTAVRGTVLAVDTDATTSAPSPGDFGPELGSLTVSPDGRTLTVGFIGAAPGPGPCSAEYDVRTAQRPGVVAVAVAVVAIPPPTAKPTPGAPLTACTLAGHPRTVTATLDAPLGDRPVLDAWRGQPIAR